jgi:ABC-type antimicrobial peptide transport system permease subunit
LTSYARRSLAARPLRSLLTIVGIALGVAVLFAALATNAAIDGAIDRTVHELLGRADLRVEGFTERGLSAASTEAIGDTAGIDGATPILERRTYLAPSVASPPSAEPPPPVTVLGIDPITYALVHDLDLAAVGLDGVTGPGPSSPRRLARQGQVGGNPLLGRMAYARADRRVLTGSGP